MRRESAALGLRSTAVRPRCAEHKGGSRRRERDSPVGAGLRAVAETTKSAQRL